MIVGSFDGIIVGPEVGLVEGRKLGPSLVLTVGSEVGFLEGVSDGKKPAIVGALDVVGSEVGDVVGCKLGLSLLVRDGNSDGLCVG